MSKVKLGEVAREYKETCSDKHGLPIVGLEHLIGGEIRLSQWDEDVDNTFTKSFRKGQVLFGRRRAYLKKAVVAPFDGICSGDITVIEAIPGKIIPELLPFIIQNDDLFDFAVGRSAGSLSPRVKWEHLQNYEFDLPEIEQQSSLAAALWAAENTKDAYKRVICSSDELVKSQFIEMFGECDEWEKMPLREAFTLQMGKTPGRDNLKLWETSDYRWISIADLSGYDKYTGETKEYLSKLAVEKLKIKPVPPNTVIMSFKLSIGKTAITSESIYTNEAIMAFIPKAQKLNLEYLRYFLMNYNWTDGLQQAVKGVTLNKDIIGKAIIFIPPIALQEQFAAFAEQLDKSKFAVKQALKDLEETQKALMLRHLG